MADRELAVEKEKGGTPIPYGIKMKFKTTKNRVAFKGRSAWFYLDFEEGVSRYDGLLELLSQYGVIKASAKPSEIGEYADSVTFTWMHPDTKEEYEFKIRTFSKYMKELPEETREEWMTIWEYQINEIYTNLTKDWDESMLLESDMNPEGEEEIVPEAQQEQSFEYEEND